jgi:hypothetical protein
MQFNRKISRRSLDAPSARQAKRAVHANHGKGPGRVMRRVGSHMRSITEVLCIESPQDPGRINRQHRAFHGEGCSPQVDRANAFGQLVCRRSEGSHEHAIGRHDPLRRDPDSSGVGLRRADVNRR